MAWIFLAILAHAGNGVVFILDKGLLGTKSEAGDPKKLAFYSGIISAFAIVLAFVEFRLPNAFAIMWSLVAGVCFVVALWLFFTALDSDDASRVVPITGSAVPVFTVLFARVFLNEPLTPQQLTAILLLVVGGALLSIGFKNVRSLSPYIVGIAVLAGVAFAGYFAAVKHLYDSFDPFWSAFAYNRFGTAVAAVILLGPYMLKNRNSSKRAKKKKIVKRTVAITAVFVGSKILSSAMFIVQSYAIKVGSVSVVNALQGTQYLFVLVLAVLLSRFLPSLYREEIKRVAIMQKILGIVAISIGLGLFV